MARLAEGHERQFWKHLYGEGTKSAQCRSESHRNFKKLFPRGHKESIRALVGSFTKPGKKHLFKRYENFKWLDNIHPDAFKIIAEYGIDYTPWIFRVPPRIGEPATRGCYQNSLKLAHGYNYGLKRSPPSKGPARRMVYVEGIVMGSLTLPMAHAWVAKGMRSRTAIDWSHYATCKWSRYIGIPFTLAEHAELARLTGRTNIFEKRYFNAKAKRRLLEMLKARKKRKKRRR